MNQQDTEQKPKNKGGRPPGKSVPAMVRQSFFLAAKRMEDGGRPLSDIIVEQMEKDPLSTLRAIAPFCPKEVTGANEGPMELVIRWGGDDRKT